MADKQYLDENGNPIVAGAAKGKVYLDEGGNPIRHSEAEQVAARPDATKQAQNVIDRTLKIPQQEQQAKWNAEERQMLDRGDLFGASTGLANLSERNARESEAVQNRALASGKPAGPLRSALDLSSRAAKVASGLTNPKNIAFGGLTAAAPEVMAPALAVHGGVGLTKGMFDLAGPNGGTPENVEGILNSGAEMSGGLAGSVGPLRATLPFRTSLGEKVVEPLVYEGIGEAAADARVGINPARGLVRAGLVGTKQSLAAKAGNRIGELKQAGNAILQNAPGGQTQLNATDAINSAVDDAIATARGQGQLDSIPRLENLRQGLLTEKGPTSGYPIDINNLKTRIQDVASELGSYNNRVPGEASAANAAGRAASNLRSQVNAAVPEAAPVNAQMADLIDARAGLNRSILADKGSNIFKGDVWSIPNKLMQRTIGSAPVRTGLARMLSAGTDRGIPVPPEMIRPPFIAPTGEPQAPPNAAGSIEGLGSPTDPTRLTRDRAVLGQSKYRAMLPSSSIPPNMQLPERSSAPVVTPAPGYSQGVVSDAPIGYSGRLTDRLVPSTPPVLPSIEGAPSPQSSGTLPTPPPAGQNALPPLPEPQPINPQEVADLQQETPRVMSDSRVNQYLRDRAAEQNIRAGLAGKRTDTAGNIREAHRAKLGGNKDKKR